MAFIKAFFFFSLEDCFLEEEDSAGETLEGAASYIYMCGSQASSKVYVKNGMSQFFFIHVYNL
jgi:hypothetical protein